MSQSLGAQHRLAPPAARDGCSPATAHRRLTAWQEAGVFGRLHRDLLEALNGTGRIASRGEGETFRRRGVTDRRPPDCKPPPGRIFIVGPSHSFGDLAQAIDTAFARWDLSHLHGFELADGRMIGIPDVDYPDEWLDESALKVAKEVKPGEAFEYTFDFGDDWRHRCEVEPEKVDPREEYGPLPDRPVPIWGWGAIPDQYGREGFEE